MPNPHDKGGLPPAPKTLKATATLERVLSPQQWETLRRWLENHR